MDWISGLQNTVNYVEEHLTEPIDYDEVAKRCYCSSYHFQRVFSILCGYTLGEYIRCRRHIIRRANGGPQGGVAIRLLYRFCDGVFGGIHPC